MVIKPQKTKFQLKVVDNLDALSSWANNPWRRYSLAFIVLLVGNFVGSQLGMVSAVKNLMDPLAAFLSVIFLELLIGLRRIFRHDRTKKTFILLIDFLRYGLFYGFFTECLKLL
tara:strand:- start:1772 stop:2113 length:342 start_codon:yes stop_codon:yes gene_type:complete